MKSGRGLSAVMAGLFGLGLLGCQHDRAGRDQMDRDIQEDIKPADAGVNDTGGGAGSAGTLDVSPGTETIDRSGGATGSGVPAGGSGAPDTIQQPRPGFDDSTVGNTGTP